MSCKFASLPKKPKIPETKIGIHMSEMRGKNKKVGIWEDPTKGKKDSNFKH